MAATTGIRQRHGNGCKRPASGCKCPWQAEVYSARDKKKIRKLFTSKAAAKGWRDDASGQVRRKELRAPVPTTLDQAAEAWLEGARAGLIRTRSGDPYKPSAIRSYEADLRLRVRPEFGHRKLADITGTDLQDFIDTLVAEGLNPSTIGGTILPLRAIYRRAVGRPDSGITVNPTTRLELPKVRSGRDRIATPDECARLLEALPRVDRALWATAIYGGLRRGELQALRVEDIDLGKGIIHVHFGWDPKEGEIPTKNRERRTVPISAILRDHLDQHLLDLQWREQPDGIVFGVEPRKPFAPSSNEQRAKRAWKAAKLDRIAMHECRHTFASLMIAAGVNAKALSTYCGHANISITMDKYGHLFPGNEDEAAALLDAYLARADTGARLAQLAAVDHNEGA
jgi:integrase